MTATATQPDPAPAVEKQRAPAIQTSKTRFIQRLSRAIEVADKEMKPYRDKGDMLVREFCGPHHGSNTPEHDRVPVNLAYLFVTSIMPHLAITPRLQAEANDPDFAYVGSALSEAVNRECKRIDLGGSFRTVLLNSLFGVAVLKIGMAVDGDPDALAQAMEDPAIFFCDPVDPHDYVEDMRRRSRKRLDFQADYDRTPIEAALATGAYKNELLEKLRNTKAQRATTAQNKPAGADDADLYDMVELLNVYLPQEQIVVTLPASHAATEGYLAEREWTGSEYGPYEMFGLTPVPGSSMALAPLPIGHDLHLLVNEVTRKIGRQAQAQKDLTVVDPSDPKLAGAVQNARDGEVIFGNPKNVARLVTGGVNPGLYQTAEHLQRKFDETMGSPETLGGAGVDANTLGQDQMKMANAGQRINAWRAEALKRGRRILTRMARYVWDDPAIDLDLKIPMGGGEFLRVKWTPDMRVGELSDYSLEIEAYSVAQDSPGQEYERINRLIKEQIIPLANIAMQSGHQLDVVRLIEVLARHADLPELQGIFKGMAPAMMQGGMGQGQGQGPSQGNTTTNISLGGRARPQPQREFMASQGQRQPEAGTESVS